VRRAVRVLLLAVAVAAILLLFVLPGRTFLSQEHSLATTQRQVNDLTSENAKLRQEAKSLQSTSEIEQIAREQYGLVMPGEKAYAVLPAAPTPTTTTPPVTAVPASHRASRGGPHHTASRTTPTTVSHRR
jgi:cell division protein FtsL